MYLWDVSREPLDPLDLLDPLERMDPEELGVRLALLVALVRLVLSDLQASAERRDPPALMELL